VVLVEQDQENLVFAEEASQWREAGKRQRSDRERRSGHRQVPGQTAHLPHVLRVRGMDDYARPEEQERLEERVRRQVEHCGAG